MAVDKGYFIFRTFDTCLKIIIIIAYNCQIKKLRNYFDYGRACNGDAKASS